MSDHILTLEKAKLFTEFREFYTIFNDRNIITDIEFEALEYLVENNREIFLPNVKELSKEKREYLKGKEHFIHLGFDIEH